MSGPRLNARELRGENFTTVGEFTLAAGETVSFVLTHGPSYRALPRALDATEALRETETFWRGWAEGAIDLPG
jgi:hypothetical protein